MERHAFTLIELLVIISIIALLIAILLSALSRAMGAATDISCMSNQRNVMGGYLSALPEYKGLTPHTDSFFQTKTLMADYIESSFKGVEALSYEDSADPNDARVCPVIDREFDRPGYQGVYFGFAVNTRLRWDGERGDNARIPWASIRSPSEYPWLADPEVRSGPTAPRRFGVSARANGQWWLGFYHDGRGMATYADGHVAQFGPEVLDERASSGVPTWLTDDDE